MGKNYSFRPMESLESRTLLDAELAHFGGEFKTQYIDGSGGQTGLGDLVTVSLSGPGSGIVHMPDYSGHYDASLIELHGTTAKTVLTITVAGKGVTTVSGITADGPLGGIVAKAVTLTGDIDIASSLGKLVLGSSSGDHTIRLHADPTMVPIPGVQASITLMSAMDLSIQANDIPIRSLKVGQWLDSADSANDVISGCVIGSIKSAGEFQADLALGGMKTVKKTLDRVKISGDMSGVDWDVTGNIGKVKLAGWAEDFCLCATGSIAGITVGGANHSDFMAGISDLCDRKADDCSLFENLDASIGSFKVKGIKTPKGLETPRFFVDSNVSAARLGTVSLLNAEFDNGDTPFGLFALQTGSGKEIKSVRYRDSVDRSLSFNWPPHKDAIFVARPDLAISLVD